MSAVRVRELDRSDEADVRTFWELNRDAVADRPYNAHLAWQAARTYIMRDGSDADTSYLVAEDAGRVVGTVRLVAPLLDNTHLAYVDVFVAADRRREGIGTRLLDEAVDRARGLGRRLLTGEAYAPVEGDSSALTFVRNKGFGVVLEDGVKVVDLVSTRPSWGPLTREVAPMHSDYRLVTSWAPVPDEQWDEARVRDRTRSATASWSAASRSRRRSDGSDQSLRSRT